MRSNTSQNAQKYFIEFDTVEYEEVLTDDQVMDRSMHTAVVGG